MQAISLDAALRKELGRQAKIVRNNNAIPAVMYGHGLETRHLTVSVPAFRKAFLEAGTSSLVDVNIEGAEPVKAIVKEVQLDPLTMAPMHVDFLQVNMKEKMTANIPLVFEGDSAAVKALGGTLVKSLDHVEVECLPADLPHQIVVDLSSLETFDDMITVGSLKLPNGVEVMNEAKQIVVSVEAPLTEEELKKLEESQIGDVTEVKAEADLKKAEEEAKATEESKENVPSS